MNFCSDNVSGVAREILTAIEAANLGPAMPYGDDELTSRLERTVAEVFEHEVAVFPVATGTAANALALSVLTPPYGVIYCHEFAHIQVDECGAPELFTAGAKLVPLPGLHGKIRASDLQAALTEAGSGNVHKVQPAVVSLTQATECGTVYSLHELQDIATVARSHTLKLHMDGARFANAVASLGCTPADASWRAGVDILSLGATKNGALGAEAMICFDLSLGRELAFRRKRGGHLFSKMRFVSAQLEAYFTGGLWLRNAAAANALARRLAEGLAQITGVRLRDPIQTNLFYVVIPPQILTGLEAAGFKFYREGGPNTIRLVTAFNTSPADVETFLAAAARLARGEEPTPMRER